VTLAACDLLPASIPCLAAGTFAEVLMLRASSTQALGSMFRPSAWRANWRRMPLSWWKTPPFCHAAKYP
jgi:hypothetical protein